jgi:predicted RNA binding protein YcfA (HicA-like mRNA interferase family)
LQWYLGALWSRLGINDEIGEPMPRKIRQLRADLAHAGFKERAKRGKGSHTWWTHPTGVTLNLPGHDGDDAKPYMEKQLREALARTQSLARQSDSLTKGDRA